MTRYTIFSRDNWDRFFLADVKAYLQQKGYVVRTEPKESFHSRTPDAAQRLRRHNTIAVRNEACGRYFLISHIDHYGVDDILPLLMEPECLGVLKCQYRPHVYGDATPKVAPFTYRVKDSDVYDRARPELLLAPRTDQTLYFKGNTIYGRERILELLGDILNPDFSSRKQEALPQQRYLAELARHRVALSLPGHGNFCHRELEAFGLGVAVVQPLLTNAYYQPLIAHVHYFAVSNDFSNPRAICSEVREGFRALLEDAHLRDTMAARAREWFDKNVPYPANMRLMEEILRDRFQYLL